MFGSPLAGHESFVRLQIGKGERIHSLGYDKFYGSMRGDFIEVNLSSAQFAELITTMNIGMGVPCTIHRVNGEKIPPPPEEPTEQEHVQLDFKRDMEKLAKDLSVVQAEVRQICEKKNLTQQDRKQIMLAVGRLVTQIGSNIPFVMESFTEATEKVVQHAKTEIDSFVTSCAMSEGMKVLALRASAENRHSAIEAAVDSPLLLEDSSDEVK